MIEENFLSKTTLEKLLLDKVSPADISKVIGSYEMSEAAHIGQLTPTGYPIFHHSTRVAKILITELNIFEPDLIVASILHNILINSDDITLTILDYNFGSNVSYLIQRITDDFKIRIGLSNAVMELDRIDDDCLIIILSDCLDILRSNDFVNFLNPFSFMDQISHRYFPTAEKRKNENISFLLDQCKKEINKING
jgi:(p)ppGpp synthase/HD superfamily hydrolase